MKKHIRATILFILFNLITSSCTLPFNTKAGEAPNQIWGLPVESIATRDPNPTATSTPFRPMSSQPTSTRKSGPTPTRKAIPPTLTATPAQLIEGGVERISQPEDQINILLLGSDYRVGAGYRTDTILLVTLNPNTGRGSMVSFPRDLYLKIPGNEEHRINTAMQSGGFEMTQDTFAYNFGVRPNFYVMTDFSGFERMVDTLGGIEIDSAKALTDWCDLPSGRKGWCSIKAGKNVVSGEMALWYARSRGGSNDFERSKRSQEIIRALFNKLISLDALTKAPAIFDQLSENIETNIRIADVLPLLPLANQVTKDGNFRQYAVGPEHVNVWIPPSGAYLLLPKENRIQLLLEEALNLDN